MNKHWHVRERDLAYCPDCVLLRKAATHEIRDEHNTSYGIYCEFHATKRANELNDRRSNHEQ